jgi:hypothetical protein
LKVCGITTAADGSEDEQIHCFKDDGPIPSGRALLSKCREERDAAEIQALLDEIDNEQGDDHEIDYSSDNSIDIET